VLIDRAFFGLSSKRKPNLNSPLGLFPSKLQTFLLCSLFAKAAGINLQTSQTRWGERNYVVKFFWRDAVEQKMSSALLLKASTEENRATVFLCVNVLFTSYS
jgi:hypothetical protein